MLLAILKAHDLEAYPILISTRGNGKMIDVYPILSQFNHVMVGVNINDNFSLMDMGSPIRPIGFPRVSALNGGGWLVDKDNPQWLSFNAPASTSREFVQFSWAEDGSINGKISGTYNGYDALDLRAQALEDPEGKFIKEDLGKTFPNIEIESVTFKNEKDLSKNMQSSVTCKIQNATQNVGDFRYVNPLVIPILEKNPFQLEERNYPIDIPYPSRVEYTFMIDIPEGFEVEEMPENIRIELPNEGGAFQYLTSVNFNKITTAIKLNIDKLKYSQEEYQGIKQFFDLIIEKHNEQIVFKSKTLEY